MCESVEAGSVSCSSESSCVGPPGGIIVILVTRTTKVLASFAQITCQSDFFFSLCNLYNGPQSCSRFCVLHRRGAASLFWQQSNESPLAHSHHTLFTYYLRKHAINNAFKGINHKNPAPAKAKHSKPYATVKQRPGEPLATDRGAVDPVM